MADVFNYTSDEARDEVRSIVNLSLHTYGLDYEMGIAVEEMSELTKEISKNTRGFDNIEALKEEIADVLNTCNTLIQGFDISPIEIISLREQKMQRLKHRIQSAGENT